jgi:hypothetical protein
MDLALKGHSLCLPAKTEPQQFGRRSLHARRGHNDFGVEKGPRAREPTIGRSKSSDGERARLQT